MSYTVTYDIKGVDEILRDDSIYVIEKVKKSHDSALVVYLYVLKRTIVELRL